MPRTVQERDQAEANRRGSWDWWLPDPLPSVNAMWPKAVWNTPVLHAATDLGRTRELHAHEHASAWVNCKTGIYEGRYSGVPWQNVAGVGMTRVWERSRGLFDNLFNPAKLPLPSTVRRIGDPAGGGDLQWVGFDARYLYEAADVTPNLLFHPWACFKVHRWDLTRAWDASGQPRGATAGGLPLLPLLATPDEFADGRIVHAQHMAVPAAKRGAYRAPARGSDATWTTHPIMYGDRLRLTEAAHKRLLAEAQTRDDVTFVEALREFGVIVDDQTGIDGTRDGRSQGNIRTCQDPNVHLTVHLLLGDFEIVAPV